MLISRERLYYTSESTGFRPEILEKVIYLIHLLNRFAEDSFLKNKFILKGGTALNLFCFDYPRLSVDIDINYIGSADCRIMLQEKTLIESAIEDIVLDEKMILQRKPSEHAGGKWSFRYPSALQNKGNIEIDLNYLDRVPLWSKVTMNSFRLGEFQANSIPVQDFHELASGKLRALFSRHSSRDLFDVHQLMTQKHLDIEKLRLGFVIYGGISRKDWRQIKPEDIHFDWREFQNMLIPLLRKTCLAKRDNPKLWAEKILDECRSALNKLFPLRENEAQFLDILLEQGKINATLLTSDRLLQKRIQSNPALLWKAENVRRFKNRK
jgi:predicted nucleotidyltransferase component of viral defense system